MKCYAERRKNILPHITKIHVLHVNFKLFSNTLSTKLREYSTLIDKITSRTEESYNSTCESIITLLKIFVCYLLKNEYFI